MAKKIPKQYRVTLKAQRVHVYNADGTLATDPVSGDYFWDPSVPPLGFANAYEPNTKAYAGRVITQDEWAYTRWNRDKVYEYKGKLWIQSSEWDRDTQKEVPYSKQVEDRLQPIIIDNVPMTGFRVQKSVTRSSTSNKVWRILDPRGFELEISSACLDDLISGCVIDRGEIMAPCLWSTCKTLINVEAS